MLQKESLFALLLFVCIAILSTGCVSAFQAVQVASTAHSTAKIVKGDKIRKDARSLERDSLGLADDVNYATYYLYRRSSFYGVAASCLIYDNDNYIGVMNNKTFEKVENVVPGLHEFKSKEDSKHSISFNIEDGKTYIFRVKQSYKLRPGEMFIMDEEMIEKELKKKKFFREKYYEYGLDLNELSTQ